MKRARSALAVALCALAALSTEAAAQLRLSAAGGPSYPLSSFGDSYDAGWHAQLSAGLAVPLIPIGLRVDAAYNRFPQDGGNFQTISGTLNGVVNIPSLILVPYLIGGAGVYNSRASVDDASNSDSETTNIGANIGAGLRLGLPGLAVFVEARIHNVFNGADVQFVPVSFGVNF